METQATAAVFYSGGKIEYRAMGAETNFSGVVNLDYILQIHVDTPGNARELAKAFKQLANDMEAANEL